MGRPTPRPRLFGLRHPAGRAMDDQERFVKLLAFLTATCMLLATYALTALRRRLGGILDNWGHDAVDRWSPAIPSPRK